MVEEVRYRSFSGGAGRNSLAMVTIRSLSENHNALYLSDKYTSSQYLSWAPPSTSPPPPFLAERIRRRQQQQQQHQQQSQRRGHCWLWKAAAPKSGLTEVPKSKSKRLKLWWNDAESKRRRRVAKYKMYEAEGKMKRTFDRGYRWFKNKCLQIVSNF